MSQYPVNLTVLSIYYTYEMSQEEPLYFILATVLIRGILKNNSKNH